MKSNDDSLITKIVDTIVSEGTIKGPGSNLIPEPAITA
jgi:hypothetical protein